MGRDLAYSAEEDTFLETSNASLTRREQAVVLGRSEASVGKRARRLGLPLVTDRRGRDPRPASWTPEHDALVRDTSLSVAEVAARLGRSPGAVRERASVLQVRREDYRRTGESHWNWQGGATREEYDRGSRWVELRLAALERDGWTCQDCYLFVPSGRGLVVHHIIPWRLLKTEALAWLVTLCGSCHMARPEHRWNEVPPVVLFLVREGL